MVDKAKKKWKKILLIIGIIFMFIFIPIVLDRFFAWKLYMLWCKKGFNSPFDESDWFSFLGSYFGVVGTIFMGTIAYRQTYIINKQSEANNELQNKVTELQKEISDFRIHPIIHIKTTSIYVRNNVRYSYIAQKELKEYYYAVYGREQKAVGTKYIVMEILFEDKGIIPTVQCEILNFEWEIAGNRYSFMISDFKRKIRAYDKLFILIDESDIAEHRDSFFEDLDLHEHYVNSGKHGYMRSVIKTKLCFTNQKGYKQSYNLFYQVKGVAGGLEVSSLFFEREGIEDEAK